MDVLKDKRMLFNALTLEERKQCVNVLKLDRKTIFEYVDDILKDSYMSIKNLKEKLDFTDMGISEYTYLNSENQFEIDEIKFNGILENSKWYNLFFEIQDKYNEKCDSIIDINSINFCLQFFVPWIDYKISFFVNNMHNISIKAEVKEEMLKNIIIH